MDRGSGYTSVTIGADGLPVISYRYNGGLDVLHCGDASCSADNSATTLDSETPPDGATSIALGVDGLPLIGYHDVVDGALKVAHCGDPFCSSGNTITAIDSRSGGAGIGDVGAGTSVIVGRDGLPVVSYYDSTTGGALKVAHCGNAACSSGNTITTVDSAGDVGPDTSVTLGADGLPLISYYDATNGALKAAHCGNAACTSGNTITTLDSGDVGAGTSVRVGADGLPSISYSANTNELRVLHCGNTTCSSGNTITTLDTVTLPPPGADVAETSITTGADGLPLITYDVSDVLYFFVGLVHCGNLACSAGNTLTTVGAGTPNLYASVTIGADGLPLISYIDLWYGFLAVEHCADVACVTPLAVVEISKNGTGSGTVSSVPAGIDCGPTCSASFDAGSSLTLTATPSAGSRFSGWSGGGCSGTNSCPIKSVGGEQAVSATFNLLPKCVTPRLIGKLLKSAERAITSHNCTLGKIKHAASPTITKGHVISQKPRPGKRFPNGAAINLVVSKGRPKLG